MSGIPTRVFITTTCSAGRFLFDFIPVERLALIGTLLAVMVTELLNSAIECTLNRINTDLRPLADRAKNYGYDHVGMNFGYEWDVNRHRVGLMGGIVSTDTQTEWFSSDANNYHVGAYGNRKMNGFNITGSLLAGYGYGDHENDRLEVDNLNEFEVA